MERSWKTCKLATALREGLEVLQVRWELDWNAMESEMEKEVLLKPPRGSVPDRGFSFKALKA